MTPTEKAIRDYCGHHADWWPSTTQVREMLALAQPEQEPVAWEDVLGAIARGWAHPENARKPMDVQLAVAIAKEIQDMYTAPPAAPTQEPRCAVIVEVFGKDWRLDYMSLPVGKHKLYTQQYVYTTPPAAQRQWVGVTDEEIESAISDGFARGLDDGNVSNKTVIKYVRGIEAALRSKNK